MNTTVESNVNSNVEALIDSCKHEMVRGVYDTITLLCGGRNWQDKYTWNYDYKAGVFSLDARVQGLAIRQLSVEVFNAFVRIKRNGSVLLEIQNEKFMPSHRNVPYWKSVGPMINETLKNVALTWNELSRVA